MVLQSIRDRLTGIVAIFIFAILIIPFAFVGVSSYFTSDAVNSVATVNDEVITIGQFTQAFQNYRRRMQSQLGEAFDPELFDQAIIRRQFLDQMINEELLSQVSIDAGLAVDDARLALAIREIPGFQVDGEFNADVYQSRLAAQGMTPQQFEAEMRASMVMDQFPGAIATSAIATDWEVRDYARLQDQQRAFRALIVPAVESGPEDEPLEVDPDAVQAWYEENKAGYVSDEQVIIEYIELDAARLGGGVEPDEDILRARFEEQETRFITPEARLASHILIEVDPAAPEVDIETARQQAEELAARVEAGEDFAAVAIEASQDIGSSEQGGDLGWVEPGFMVQAFEDALYELNLDTPVSEPVRTGFGWHIIQLRDIRPSEGMSFTEARETLLAEYRAEEDERRFLEQADRLIDIIYEDPTTLDAAAEELGLDVMEAGPFGRTGGDAGISANMEVVNAAFSDLVLAQAAVSDPVDLGTNHIVLIRLKEHLPEVQLPLEDVRDQVVASVRREQAMETAAAAADTLLASLQESSDFASLAETSGLELVESEAATRNDPAIDPILRSQLFLLPAPGEDGPVSKVVELNNAYAVVQLESVTDGEMSDEDLLKSQAYGRRIANASASVETLGFLQMLREQSTIEVYEDRL